MLLVSIFYTAALAFVIVQEKRNTDCKVKSIEDSKSLWSVDRGMTAMLLRRDTGVQCTWILSVDK